MLISWKNFNLIIARKIIHEGKNLTPGTVVNDLINKRSRIIILGTSLINITIINVYSNGSLFLIYKNNIRDPFCQRNQINETRFEKLFHFGLNGSNFPRMHQTKTLINKFRIVLSRNFMHHSTRINSGNLFVGPCKDITEFSEKASVDSYFI